MAEEQQKQFKAKLTEDMEAGVYANAVSVHLNANELVLDMAYVLPNTPEPMLRVVSRVNMSHKTAKSFLNVLSNAILDYENKNKSPSAKRTQGQ